MQPLLKSLFSDMNRLVSAGVLGHAQEQKQKPRQNQYRKLTLEEAIALLCNGGTVNSRTPNNKKKK